MRFIAAALACSLAFAPATALAQRGNSGLPDNPGNPIADLQRQIDELRGIVNSLTGTPTAVTVNCGLGQTISATLAAFPGALTITVIGTCTENVTITRDDVVIQGSGGAGVTGASSTVPVIRLDGAHRVRITGLTLTGGDSGVSGQRGSTFDLSACTVQGGARFGVIATNGSTGTVDGCTVTGSGGQGVVAAQDSSMYVTNSTIENHAQQGVTASRSSHVRLGQDISSTNVVKPVMVRNNGQNGVTTVDSSTLIVVGSTVENNANTGIFVGRGSAGQIGVGSLGLMAGVLVQGNGRDGIAVEAGQATILGSTITLNDRTGIMVHNNAGARIGITDGSTAYVGNNITSNGYTGIHVNGGSSAYIGGNIISANGTDPAAGLGRHGIGVFAASINLAGANVITNHPAAGIFVGRSAGAHIGDANFGLPVTGANANVISGNSATDPGTKGGIVAFQGGVVDVRDTVISGNFGFGIQAFEAGVVEVRRGSITGTISLPGFPGHGVNGGLQSTIRLRGPVSVTGNASDGVFVGNGTAVDFRDDGGVPSVTGNFGPFGLNCGGTEASFSASPFPLGTSGISSISPSCTGF